MAKNSEGIHHREQGISMFEFVWVIVILMILYAISYKYLAAMNETVERTDFVRTLNRMQAQLTLNVAEWYALGSHVSRKAIEKKNPIDLIELVPENYQGELESKDLSKCELAHWCYLTDTQKLVYRVKHTAELRNDFSQEDVLVYRLKISFVEGQRDKGLPTELVLIPKYKFTWQNVRF